MPAALAAAVRSACGLLLLAGCGGDGAGNGTPSDAGGSDDAADAADPCGDPGPGPAVPCREPADATVQAILDGDTMDVVVDGAEERVRLVGVDAPESGEGECGSAAEAWLRDRLPAGSAVRLRFDVECEDAFGRTLAYLDDAAFVNADMIRDGYAKACPYEPNVAHEDYLACLEALAEAEQAGLWEIGCNRDGCFE